VSSAIEPSIKLSFVLTRTSMSWRPLCLASYHGIDVPATPLRIRLMRGWLAWTTMTTIATSCNRQQEEPGDTGTCAWLRQGFRVICRNLRHKVKHFAFAEVDLIPRRHLFFPLSTEHGLSPGVTDAKESHLRRAAILEGRPLPHGQHHGTLHAHPFQL